MSLSRGELQSHLRHSKEVLGDVNDTSQSLNVLNPLLDGTGVLLPGAVQDVLDLVVVTFSPFPVHRPTVMCDSPEYGEQRDHDDGFLVDHVKLIADGSN